MLYFNSFIKEGVIMSFLKLILVLILSFYGCTTKPSTKEKKIVIWHWMNDREEAFNELANRYREKTGITVVFKLFSPPDIYSQKIIAAARAGNLPDIFGILGEKKTFASFIKAGHILSLNNYMYENSNNWFNKFYPQTIKVVMFEKNNIYGIEEGIYAVPLDTTIMQFIYNKTLFKKAGIDLNPPQTFEEFIEVSKNIKEKLNVAGFASGWAESWLLNCLATEWAINIMGEEKFLKTIESKIPYTDPDWIKVFELFEKIRDSGILMPNIITTINKEAEDIFSKNKAAFSFNGTWAINVYKQLSSDLDYDFFSLPKAEPKNPIKIWGGAGTYFMVNAKSENKEEAVKFLKWLTEEEQQIFLIEKTNNLPAVRGCEDKLPEKMKKLLFNLENLTHPNIWKYNEDSRVIEIINTGLQQIILGIKDAKSLASEIQKEKERITLKNE